MGKKLAAMSKAARERKKQLSNSANAVTPSDSEVWSINYGYLIGLAGLVIAVGSLYCSRGWKRDRMNRKHQRQ